MQSSDINSSQKPRHVAIIMDGNGRWAKSKNKPRLEGHRQGALTVRRIVEEARKEGVEFLSLFSFSTENWNRTEEEVSGLMKLFKQYLISELKSLQKNGIRLKAVGDLDRLPLDVQEALTKASAETSVDYSLTLVLAVSYGGKEDIVQAARSLAQQVKSGQLDPEEIDNQLFENTLWTNGIPNPDLLIRTSGESRISNFMLWQLAYSEIVISEKLWPEFEAEDFKQCLENFASRDRRFGLNFTAVDAVAKKESGNSKRTSC